MLEPTTQDSLPRRLGVYEVITPIAKRPASTVVIAHREHREQRAAAGAKGLDEQRRFERVVAIKRIAPALVQMNDSKPFLLAMNKVSTLVHPNAARVLETAHDQGELFVVMEYLEGESVAALLRRAHARGETLDFSLCAYLIAEASAALDAAHKLGVLHTHITPRDLFVCYDGTVKVLDLGVASALDRMAESEMRGRELQYASPERCRLEKLDAQTDVFSLGAILWELAAGTSPFDRVDEADTIRAICEESIVPPATVVRGLPTQFSDITMRALTRSKLKRYQSALLLREALLDLLKRFAMASSLKNDLAHLMQKLFSDRIKDKQDMLSRTTSGATVLGLNLGELDGENEPSKAASVPPAVTIAKPPVPKAKATVGIGSVAVAVAPHAPPASASPADEEVDSIILDPSIKPVVAVVAAAAATSSPRLPISPVHQGRILTPTEISISRISKVVSEEKKKKSRLTLFVALFGIVLSLGTIGVAFGLRAMSDRPTTTTTTTATAPPTATTALVNVVPAASSATVTASELLPVASAAPSASASASATASEESTVHVETVPTKAAVFIAGTKRGTTPVDLKLPKNKDALTIEIRHPGYQTHKERVVPDVDQKLRLTLSPAPAAKPGDLNYRRFD